MNIINSEKWLQSPRTLAGIMTGTSGDGVDVCFAKFERRDGKDKFEILAFDTYPFPEEFKRKMGAITGGDFTLRDISQFNFALSALYAESIKKLCRDNKFGLDDLDAVGIHGQTLWHEPSPALFGEILTASTYQAASCPALAAIIHKPVAGDFRAADIVLGGQGAPLVPIFDYEFLADKNIDVIALNIGGISNITYMPAGCGKESVSAFDAGPGNMLIDLYMKKFFSKDYDYCGETARKGKTIDVLLESLMNTPFIIQNPPKSSGRELFNERFVKNHLKDTSSAYVPEDIIRTLTELTACSIAENIKRFANPESVVIASGGGVYNLFLMETLQKYLPGTDIKISSDYGIPPGAKEALCFAYLAYRTFGGLPGNLPSATGASKEAVLGVLALP